MINVDDCVRELERCYKDLHMHGIMMPTNVAGKYIDEPEFMPFWDALAAGDKPLFLHPANAPCQSNWEKYSLHQKILWPACRQEPEVYFKKIFYDTAGPIRAEFIKLVYDTVGAEQILFGADYPHGRAGRDDQFYPMTLDAMVKLDIPQADKDKIYYLNAKKLFGI